MIRFEDVSLTYRGAKKPSLDGLSFSIGPGEFVWLTGPTGAGKSSVLRLIHRAERPSQGKVSVADRDLDSLNRKDLPRLRQKVALVDGRPRLMRTRTLLENVRLPLRLSGENPQIAERKARAALIDAGLGHRIKATAAEVSEGEQLLCAMARAMVQAPFILLADEPTAGLDPELTAGFEKLLNRTWIRGTTVVLATSDPTLYAETTHRMLRFERGALLGEEPSTDPPKIVHPTCIDRSL